MSSDSELSLRRWEVAAAVAASGIPLRDGEKGFQNVSQVKATYAAWVSDYIEGHIGVDAGLFELVEHDRRGRAFGWAFRARVEPRFYPDTRRLGWGGGFFVGAAVSFGVAVVEGHAGDGSVIGGTYLSSQLVAKVGAATTLRNDIDAEVVVAVFGGKQYLLPDGENPVRARPPREEDIWFESPRSLDSLLAGLEAGVRF